MAKGQLTAGDYTYAAHVGVKSYIICSLLIRNIDLLVYLVALVSEARCVSLWKRDFQHS